jgi:hypothetical protein
VEAGDKVILDEKKNAFGLAIDSINYAGVDTEDDALPDDRK